MKKLILILAAFCVFSSGAVAQVCNSPSGFLQSFGSITIGHNLILGPDCNHVVDGGSTGPAANSLSFPVALFNGVTNFGNLTNAAQNVIQYQGQGNSKTTSWHLNPGSGTLPIDTITEYVTEGTNGQAFGGNYRRWSFSTLGSSLANRTGLVGETGGTGPIADFILQNGDENPPATFTVQNFIFAKATATTSEASQLGAVEFGNGDTTPINKIVTNIANIGAPGTRDSHAFLQEGKSNNGADAAVWWRGRVNVLNNAGASQYIWQQNFNGGGWTTRASLTDAGAFTIASLISPLHVGGAAVGSSLELRSTSAVGTTDFIKLAVGNNGGTEAMRIIDSGAIGIGTTTPQYNVQIHAGTGNSFLQLSNATTGSGAGDGGILGYVGGSSELRISQLENDNIFFITNNGSGIMRLWAGQGITLGNSCIATNPGANNVLACGLVQTGSVVVGSLPACVAGTRAARYFVTDATATFTAGIGAAVVGGGANAVPVTCDGATWRIG